MIADVCTVAASDVDEKKLEEEAKSPAVRGGTEDPDLPPIATESTAAKEASSKAAGRAL